MSDISITQLLIRREKEKEKYFKNYLEYAKLLKKEAQEFLGEAKVLIFGSILRKKEVPQDIDILIISPKLKNLSQKREVRVKLQKRVGFGAPFEIHLITPEEYRDWYKNFIKEKNVI